MNFDNPPAICVSECYICMNKMYFEDYAYHKKQRMTQTCGDIKHQCCLGCFNKIQSLECPMCRSPLLYIPKSQYVPIPTNTFYFLMLNGFEELEL